MSEARKNLVLLVCAILVSSLVVEAAFRVASGVSLFDFSNFRISRVIAINLSDVTDYDSDLGWKFGGNLLRQYWPTLNRRLKLVPTTPDSTTKSN